MIKDLWFNQKLRVVIFQALLATLVVFVCYQMFVNLQLNLTERGVKAGFGFLEERAGFGIIMSLIPYDQTESYFRTFWVGLLNTLLVSFLGIILATLLGFIIGLARLSDNWLVKKIAGVYVETLRNIPLLLQIFFWYFAVLRSLPYPKESFECLGLVFNNRGFYVPKFNLNLVQLPFYTIIVSSGIIWFFKKKERSIKGVLFITCLILFVEIALFKGQWLISYPRLTGFNYEGGWVLIPELIALLAALSLYMAAFIAEIVRLGVLSVPKGQKEAAFALGLRKQDMLRWIIIPQAMRVIIPPLTNQFLNLTKNSSLATAIAYPDLVSVFAGTVLNQTGQAVEIIAMTMGVYLCISLSISFSMHLYEKQFKWRKIP